MIEHPLWCLDVEASGLSPGSFPVEIGWCAVGGGRNWVSHLVAPHENWTMDFWDYGSQNIHGIDRQETIESGRSVRELALLLNRTFSGQRVLSDAPSFDEMWLQRLFSAAEIAPTFRLSGLEVYLLNIMELFESRPDALLNWLERAMEGARDAIPHNHRAGQDAASAAYMVDLIRTAQSENELRQFLRTDATHRRLCLISANVPPLMLDGLCSD